MLEVKIRLHRFRSVDTGSPGCGRGRVSSSHVRRKSPWRQLVSNRSGLAFIVLASEEVGVEPESQTTARQQTTIS